MDSFTPKQQPESPLKNNPPEYLISLQNHSLERSKFPLPLDITFSRSRPKNPTFSMFLSPPFTKSISSPENQPRSLPKKKLFFLSLIPKQTLTQNVADVLPCFCPTIFGIRAARFLLNWANNGNNQRQYGECVSTSNSHFQR